jgi:sugar-specific transcriptional regulator TrmB
MNIVSTIKNLFNRKQTTNKEDLISRLESLERKLNQYIQEQKEMNNFLNTEINELGKAYSSLDDLISSVDDLTESIPNSDEITEQVVDYIKRSL